MITHIRIQNLRSLVDTGFIEIKPLTILLGANSSGKSTFLRSFPLFTQSVSKSLREPISWFDDAYVDFGDFDTAKSKMASEEEGIKFSYKISKPISFFGRGRIHSSYSIHKIISSLISIIEDCQVELSYQRDSKGGVYVNGVEVQTEKLTVGFSVKEKSGPIIIVVNGQPLDTDLKWKWNFGPHNVLVPEFEKKRISEGSFQTFEEALELIAVNKIKSHCKKTLTNIDKIKNLLDAWTIDKAEFLEVLKHAPLLAVFRKHSENWNVNTEDFITIYNLIASARVASCMSAIDVELRGLYSGCSYIAPMRAAANRYYRSQGLQVRDVDPYGRNLSEFISSLSVQRRSLYEEFTQNTLGLKVSVENRTGHQSIYLKKDNKEYNLTDVGFGYSQILPIVTKLWYSSFMDNVQKNVYDIFGELIIIEQPELHLHPAMQAKTADIMMLVLNDLNAKEEIKKERYNKIHSEGWIYRKAFMMAPKMIVETHSQAMINRIGKRIREKRFSADNVSILLFEKDQETGVTSIRPIKYNEEGQLTNWPYGFFEPTDDYDILFDRQSQNKGE